MFHTEALSGIESIIAPSRGVVFAIGEICDGVKMILLIQFQGRQRHVAPWIGRLTFNRNPHRPRPRGSAERYAGIQNKADDSKSVEDESVIQDHLPLMGYLY